MTTLCYFVMFGGWGGGSVKHPGKSVQTLVVCKFSAYCVDSYRKIMIITAASMDPVLCAPGMVLILRVGCLVYSSQPYCELSSLFISTLEMAKMKPRGKVTYPSSFSFKEHNMELKCQLPLHQKLGF